MNKELTYKIAKVIPKPLRNLIKKFYNPIIPQTLKIGYGEVLMPKENLVFMLSKLKEVLKNKGGDIIEFGVYKGGSIIFFAKILMELNIKKNKLLILQAPFLFLFQLISLIKLIRKFKINILHSHWIIPQGISGAIVKRIFKIKHVLTIHGADLFVLLKMPFGKEIIKFVIKNSDEVTCVNHEIKEKIKKIIDKKNINVIPMGVNVKDYLTKPKFNNKILFLGRLAEKKGVKYVLEAAKYLSKFKFYIAGDGPLRNELELFVKRNKIKNVRFLGYIHGKNKIKLIKESGIFIIPSIHTKGGDREGLPVSLLEAMAASKAIITTDVGGIKDLIKNDYNGIIIKEKNYNEIVNAVSRLKKDFAKKLGSNARKTVLDYDWKIIGMKHYNILKR